MKVIKIDEMGLNCVVIFENLFYVKTNQRIGKKNQRRWREKSTQYLFLFIPQLGIMSPHI